MRTAVIVGLALATASTALAQGTQTRVPVTKDGSRAPIKPGEAPPPPPSAEDTQKAALSLEEAASKGDVQAGAAAIAALRGTFDEKLEGKMRAGLAHLQSGALAKAERLFASAKETDPASKPASLAYQLASTARERAEKQALAEIGTAEDPREAAATLAAGYAVDENNPRAKAAYAKLQARAQKSYGAVPPEQLAQMVSALGMLENIGGDMQARLSEAGELLKAGKLGEAQASYADARKGVLGARTSEVAALGETWVRGRRIAELEKALKRVAATDDVIAESKVVQALLDVDANNRAALARKKNLASRLVATRSARASALAEAKAWGAAHYVASKGLALTPNASKLQKIRDEARADLKKRGDFIMVIAAPRLEEGASACTELPSVLQSALATTASKRDDLGGWVLSPAWTEAWKKGDDRVPSVEGQIEVVLSACSITPSSAEATLQWTVRVPQMAEGEVVAQGELGAVVDASIIPKDEQVASGRGARRVLSEKISEAVTEAMSQSRDSMDQWLLRMAQYYARAGEPEKVADAHARLLMDKPISLDDNGMAGVEAYLGEAYP
ncbi:MAG: hypothetical protein AAF627_06825 [Myxococcota bacterium]